MITYEIQYLKVYTLKSTRISEHYGAVIKKE